MQVIGIMKVSENLEQFRINLARAFEHMRIAARARKLESKVKRQQDHDGEVGQLNFFDEMGYL